MDSCQTSVVKHSGSPARKQHALSGLGRHARNAKAAFKRQDKNAGKPSDIIPASIVIPGIEDVRRKICDECGTMVVVDSESKKSPDHVFYEDSQAETAKITKESRLDILKGKSNYDTWAANVLADLRRREIAYVLEPDAPLNNAHSRYDDMVARKIIYHHISAARADRLCRLVGQLRVAWHVWSMLRSDVLSCPCNDLNEVATNRPEELLKYQESAEDGCESCELILDAIKAYNAGWIGPSNESSLSMKAKSISAKVSSYLVQVTLEGGFTSGRTFEFFVRPGK
jgi:hypothetical protein